MGVLTDCFAATDDELKSGALAHGPLNHLPAVEGKGIDFEFLVRLLLAATGASESDCQLEIGNCFAQARLCPGNDEAAIVPLPNHLAERIAEADAAELMRIRVEIEHRSEAEIRKDALFGIVPDWLEEFAELSRNAPQKARKIYLWMCP